MFDIIGSFLDGIADWFSVVGCLAQLIGTVIIGGLVLFLVAFCVALVAVSI